MIPLTNELFDKVINVRLTKGEFLINPSNKKVDNAGEVEVIETPSKGVKPQINLQGKMFLSPGIHEMQLRVTNLFLSQPISSYGKIGITVGYAGNDPLLKTSLYGSVQFAYQETPGPDGVTCFFFFPNAKFNEWLNNPFSKTYDKVMAPGYTISSVLGDVCKTAGYTLKVCDIAGIESIPIETNLVFNGTVKEAIEKVVEMFSTHENPMYYRVDGETLLIFNKKNGTGIRKKINYITAPPKKDVSGFSLVTLFDPTIKPGDIVEFSPEYARMTFGASIFEQSGKYLVSAIDFEFDTVESVNMARIQAFDTSVIGV